MLKVDVGKVIKQLDMSPRELMSTSVLTELFAKTYQVSWGRRSWTDLGTLVFSNKSLLTEDEKKIFEAREQMT